MPSSHDTAIALIAARGGTVRTVEALAAGIHPRTLYALRDAGRLVQFSRGLFRIAGLPPVGDPDLAAIAGRIPRGVVCLVSALALHGLTTQIPHAVHLALPRTARHPVLPGIPITVYRFSTASHGAGVITHDLGGATVRVYDREKTIADCFKFRNRFGLDIVLEALAAYRRQPGASLQRVLDYARIDRVEAGIRPYLEAGS